MAHFDGLVLGRKRLSHKDRLFKVFMGDFFVLHAGLVCIEHQRDSPIGEPALTKLRPVRFKNAILYG